MVYGGSLENCWMSKSRGFESYTLRKVVCIGYHHTIFISKRSHDPLDIRVLDCIRGFLNVLQKNLVLAFGSADSTLSISETF